MNDDRRPRVLIVDDDPSIRRMLSASLGAVGYQTADALRALVKSCLG